MAKNWKVGEAVQAIKAGDKEATQDIGRRFPLFAVLAAQTNEAGVEILNMLPDYVTARKIEMGLKSGVADSEGAEGDDEEKEEKAPAPKDEKKDSKADKTGKDDKKAPKDEKKDSKKDDKKAAAKEEESYEGKSAKELFTLCKDRGIKVEPKKDAEIYIKALKKDDAAKAKAAKKDDDEDWGDDDKKEDKKADKKGAKADDDDWDI